MLSKSTLNKLSDIASKIHALNEAVLKVGYDLDDLIEHYCTEFEYTETQALKEIKKSYSLLIKLL